MISGFEGIKGSTFDDFLSGHTLDNILPPGLGEDHVYGGLGNDVFVFEDNFGFDEVRDFDRGDNVLDLQSLHLVDFDDFIRHAEQKTSGVKFIFETGDGFFMGGMVIADLEAGDVIL